MNYKFFVFALSLFLCLSVESNSADETRPVVEVNTLGQDIDYSYGYDEDVVNFVVGYKEVNGYTRNWFVLVNVHTDMQLNLTNVFDPSKRTLKWATPYENVLDNIFTVGDFHEKPALLREWTGGQFRRHVSFILIPPHKTVRFKIGYAAPQRGETFGIKTGHGMQIRFKDLPAGTIVLVSPLVTEAQVAKPKEKKTFSLLKLLKNAIATYNQKIIGKKIPEDLAERKNYQYHVNDIDKVIEFHTCKAHPCPQL